MFRHISIPRKRSGNQQQPEQLGKLVQEKDEEEPATERRREYTNLGERHEDVACHASALALAMTDEGGRQAEM